MLKKNNKKIINTKIEIKYTNNKINNKNNK